MAEDNRPQLLRPRARTDETPPETTSAADATPAAADRQPAEGVLTGHLAGIDDEGRLLFHADGGTEVIPVSIGVMLSESELVQAAWAGKRVLVLQTSGEPGEAVLIALVRERISKDARNAFPGGVNVSVEGDLVRISAARELELRCGNARILLRKDGRIETSGTHLVSRSRGPIKIKGATVELN